MQKPDPQTTAFERGLSIAADAMFMVAAPDELPLASDCPELHGELKRQASAAITGFLRSLPNAALNNCDQSWLNGLSLHGLAGHLEETANG